jgi:dTDP-D-glucose 4,6-dehydratase
VGYGFGQSFLYVEDCAKAIVMATEHYDNPEPVNIGAGREIGIRDLVELIGGLTGFKGEIRWDASKPDGQPRRCLDVSRAQHEFGFRASTDFVDGLRNTIDWYRRFGVAISATASFKFGRKPHRGIQWAIRSGLHEAVGGDRFLTDFSARYVTRPIGRRLPSEVSSIWT